MDALNVQSLIEHAIAGIPMGGFLLWFIKREFLRFENRQEKHDEDIQELKGGHGRHNVRLDRVEYVVEHHDAKIELHDAKLAELK